MAASRKSESASKSLAAKKPGKKKPAKEQLAKLAKKPGGKHMTASAHLPKQIVAVDVRVIYCTPKGEVREMVLDTSKVHGLVWDHRAHDTTLPPPGKPQTGPGTRPHRKGPPRKLGKCDSPKAKKAVRRAMFASGACCWWNGKRWICPDEFE